jgi:hypothetical protein
MRPKAQRFYLPRQLTAAAGLEEGRSFLEIYANQGANSLICINLSA